MRNIPFNIGVVHFVGIGGIGMSGIAEVMHNLGYKIQGSDVADNAHVKRLRDLGVPIVIGHQARNIEGVGVVVVSSAIHETNPEVQSARTQHIPVVQRAEMLAELMRLKWAISIGGTHGKTTTTSLVAALLDAAMMDPTVINGGIINAWGSNARLGSGDWMVVEADESDGTFAKLPSTICVVTNIDAEHMNHYGHFDALRQAFHTFVTHIPFYGFACLCIDHPEVQALMSKITDRRVVSYGFSPQAEVRGVNVSIDINGARFDVDVCSDRLKEQCSIKDLHLPMFGEHNVQNALAAVSVGLYMGLGEAAIRRALSEFKGVKRRFTRVGESEGVTVIDDYGHHPVEIKAVLKAARHATQGKVIAVVQPHRYSRLQDLFEDFCTCFNDAEEVVVADVYSAGEEPIEGADRDALIRGLHNHGHRGVHCLDDPLDLAPLVHSLARSGDLVVCLGAGNITTWAQALPKQLDALSPSFSLEPVSSGQLKISS